MGVEELSTSANDHMLSPSSSVTRSNFFDPRIFVRPSESRDAAKQVLPACLLRIVDAVHALLKSRIYLMALAGKSH
jgi:hypothetical protein